MTRVRVDLNISLDGFATTTDQTPENPFGEDWGRLTAAYVATRTFRERVLHDDSGDGTTGVDDEYARRYFEAVGAEIMGAACSGCTSSPTTPSGAAGGGRAAVPVSRLRAHAHAARLDRDGGGHHVPLPDGDPAGGARLATDAAAGGDVRIGGGPTTVQAIPQGWPRRRPPRGHRPDHPRQRHSPVGRPPRPRGHQSA